MDKFLAIPISIYAFKLLFAMQGFISHSSLVVVESYTSSSPYFMSNLSLVILVKRICYKKNSGRANDLRHPPRPLLATTTTTSPYTHTLLTTKHFVFCLIILFHGPPAPLHIQPNVSVFPFEMFSLAMFIPFVY